MKNIILIFCALFLSACLQIDDYGDYASKTAIDPRLPGNWDQKSSMGMDKGPDGKPFQHTPGGDVSVTEEKVDGAYRLTPRDGKGHPDLFWTLDLGQYHFLTDQKPVHNSICVKCYLYKYDVAGDTMGIYDLDADMAQDFLKKHYPLTSSVEVHPWGSAKIVEIKSLNEEAVKILTEMAGDESLWKLDKEWHRHPSAADKTS